MRPDHVSEFEKLPFIVLAMKKNERKVLSIFNRTKGVERTTMIQPTTSFDVVFLYRSTGSQIGKCFAIITELLV
jgi:hypothetical protein